MSVRVAIVEAGILGKSSGECRLMASRGSPSQGIGDLLPLCYGLPVNGEQPRSCGRSSPSLPLSLLSQVHATNVRGLQ
jgi:hypothetical protein